MNSLNFNMVYWGRPTWHYEEILGHAPPPIHVSLVLRMGFVQNNLCDDLDFVSEILTWK